MFISKLGENVVDDITMFKGQCKVCDSEFYFNENELKGLYEKREIRSSDGEKFQVMTVMATWHSPLDGTLICLIHCPCCNELVRLNQVTCTHKTYTDLKNRYKAILDSLVKYNGIYPVKFKCPNSRLSIDVKKRIEKLKKSRLEECGYEVLLHDKK